MKTFGVLPLAVALVLSGCGLFAQTGGGGEYEKQIREVLAPGALGDTPLEDFLTRADLRKRLGDRADEILDQVRRTRTATALARTSSSGSAGPRSASLSAEASTFSIPAFANKLAIQLDALTKYGQGGYERTDPPYTSTERGANTTTTTTLSVAERYTGRGAHVEGRETWTHRTTTTEIASGQIVFDLADERTLTGNIEVCPDGAGLVPASLEVRASLSATAPTSATRSLLSTSTFRGTVDDGANLLSVSQTHSDEQRWETSSGSGGFSGSHSASWSAGGGGFLAGLDGSSVSGTVTPSGDASLADASRLSGWDFALDAYALDGAYKEAQNLWRHGRCVVVAAPDYSAETPVDVEAQLTSQHQEEVDTGSETKFTVRLKHRFGGEGLSQPTMAAITSGEKKLEPSRLEGSGGQLTYSAPDEPDKNADAQLRSTSKRGIGTLVLTFRTAGMDLIIGARGTVNLTTGSPISYTGTMTIGPITVRRDGAVLAGHGPLHMDLEARGLPFPCEVTFTDDGDVAITVTPEKRGEDTVYVVRPDQRNSGGENMTSKNCIPGSSASIFNPPGGGYGTLFLQAAGDVVIPKDGGTVSIRGTKVVAGSTSLEVQGTMTGTIQRRS
jgi:hypothetical protein